MSNFNKVFLVVKRRCAAQKKLAEINCFSTIAVEAGVAENKLPLYLGHLQEMGLIKYSVADNYIHLTAKGNNQDNIGDIIKPT